MFPATKSVLHGRNRCSGAFVARAFETRASSCICLSTHMHTYATLFVIVFSGSKVTDLLAENCNIGFVMMTCFWHKRCCLLTVHPPPQRQRPGVCRETQEIPGLRTPAPRAGAKQNLVPWRARYMAMWFAVTLARDERLIFLLCALQRYTLFSGPETKPSCTWG